VSTEVEPNDWTSLDSWWSAYAQVWPAARNTDSVGDLQISRAAGRWNELDTWWQTHDNSSPHASGIDSSWSLHSEWLIDSWEELDPWWEVYAKTGHETVVEIADLLEQSNEAWRQSAAPFDTDPLASPLTPDRGPLLPSNEEGWSDWLGTLLRSSEALVVELFDVDVDGVPDEVIREDQLSKQEGGFRRPDILVFHVDRAVSIEVKLGDENYGKTAETARLAEQHYGDHGWTHFLLLPERKRGALESIVDPPVEPGCSDQLRVEWESPGPVTVIYWHDVIAAIRTLLRRGEAVDDEWAANAYLFCAAVEQQTLGFQPQPVIEEMADPGDVIKTIQPSALAGVLGEQLKYLKARQNL